MPIPISDQDAELLSAYIDGELSVSAREALEARLAHDKALQQELFALQQMIAAIHAMPTLKAPRDLRLRPDQVQPKVIQFSKSPRLEWTLGVAAAVLVLVVGAGILVVNAPQPNNTALVANAPTQSPVMTLTPEETPQAENALLQAESVLAQPTEQQAQTMQGAVASGGMAQRQALPTMTLENIQEAMATPTLAFTEVAMEAFSAMMPAPTSSDLADAVPAPIEDGTMGMAAGVPAEETGSFGTMSLPPNAPPQANLLPQGTPSEETVELMTNMPRTLLEPVTEAKNSGLSGWLAEFNGGVLVVILVAVLRALGVIA